MHNAAAAGQWCGVDRQCQIRRCGYRGVMDGVPLMTVSRRRFDHAGLTMRQDRVMLVAAVVLRLTIHYLWTRP
jgi:hypothetical protein